MNIEESEAMARQRIADIAQRQTTLAARVAQMQSRLANQLDAQAAGILARPGTADAAVLAWAKQDLVNVVGSWAKDVVAIGEASGTYFNQLTGGAKDFLAVQAQAVPMLLSRFGLTAAGAMTKGGFFDLFIHDTRLRQQVAAEAWKSKASGIGLQQFKRNVNELVEGAPDRAGLVERHFNTFAYDTYQQADATTQDFYAVKLKLPAALYLGGEIAGSREFCIERNGNVYTREEIAAWLDLPFAGKTPQYNPFTDRGGYNCRHHYHYITARMAAKRRQDLYVGTDGQLYKQGQREPIATAPAKATPPAPEQPAPEAQVASSPVLETPPAEYKTNEQLAAALKAGGWEPNEYLKASQFNEAASGLNMQRLGTTLRAQIEAAGVSNVELKAYEFGDTHIRLSATGQMQGKLGAEYFSMERTLGRNELGQRTVSHDYFKVPKNLQGSGLSKKLFSTYYTEYKAAGVELIEVGANLDVGGYTWAKYGFEANEEYVVKQVLRDVRKNASRLADKVPGVYDTALEMDGIVKSFYEKNPYSTPFPMDRLAALKNAKPLLLGTDWHGVLDLTNPSRRAIWEAYLKK